MHNTNTGKPTTTCAVILAGGRGSRMSNTHKPMAKLGSFTLVERMIRRIQPQVNECILSVNDDAQRFDLPQPAQLLRTVVDTHKPARGPLEGLLSAMLTLESCESSCQFLLAVPTDCPFVPNNLALRLIENIKESGSPVSFARYKSKDHYLCSLWSVPCAETIRQYLNGDNYSVRGLLKQLNASACDFSDEPYNPFFNINTPEDLLEAEKRLNSYNK